MRTVMSLISLSALVSVLCACASAPPPAPAQVPASMMLTPQPCTPDPYTDPYACGQSGAGYYDSAPYTAYPTLVSPYYPGAFPLPPPPVKKPPTPPAPPAKPPVKPAKPKPQPCRKSDKACP